MLHRQLAPEAQAPRGGAQGPMGVVATGGTAPHRTALHQDAADGGWLAVVFGEAGGLLRRLGGWEVGRLGDIKETL